MQPGSLCDTCLRHKDGLRCQKMPAHAQSMPTGSCSDADTVQYLTERGVAVHTFEAEMSDELTVRHGEEVVRYYLLANVLGNILPA